MSEQDPIECDTHGTAFQTFVCRHLLEGTNRDWYSADPDAENSWPDSWCGICHEHYEREGEWNEKSELSANLGNNLKLLCHLCYDSKRKQSIFHAV
jgi:hypothetical protein